LKEAIVITWNELDLLLFSKKQYILNAILVNV